MPLALWSRADPNFIVLCVLCAMGLALNEAPRYHRRGWTLETALAIVGAVLVLGAGLVAAAIRLLAA